MMKILRSPIVLILLIALPSIKGFSQTQNIFTTMQTVPATMTMGGAAATFTVKISNGDNVNEVIGDKLKVNLPAGATYVAGSVARGSATLVSVLGNPAESDVTNLNQPVFSIPKLPASGHFYVDLQIILGCSYSNSKSGEMSKFYYSVVDGSGATTGSNSVAQHNGLSTVIQPVLDVKTVTMHSGLDSVLVYTTSVRKIILVNSGTIDITLPMLRTKLLAIQQAVSYTNLAGDKVLSVQTPVTASGITTTTMVIPNNTLNDFITTGTKDNILQPGEEITILETVKLTGCPAPGNYSLPAIYAGGIDVNNNGSMCSPSADLTNNMKLMVSSAKPVVTSVLTTIGGLIGEGLLTYHVRNDGADGSNPGKANAYNINFDSNWIVVSARIKDGPSLRIAGRTLYFDQIYTDPSGPSIKGLKDLDGDLQFDDLEGAADFYVEVKYKFPLASGSGPTPAQLPLANSNIGSYIKYTNQCGDPITGIGGNFPVAYQSTTITNPKVDDISLIIGEQTYFSSIFSLGRNVIWSATTAYAILTLPDGLVYDATYGGGNITINNNIISPSNITVSPDGKKLSILSTSNDLADFKIPVKAMAQATPSDFADDIIKLEWRVRYPGDAGLTDNNKLDSEGYFKINQVTQPVLYTIIDPNIVCANLITTTNFTAARSNFGYKDTNFTDRTQASDYPDLKTNYGTTRDRVTHVLEGVVHGALTGTIWAKVQYDPTGNIATVNTSFVVRGGRILINGTKRVDLLSSDFIDEYGTSSPVITLHTMKLNLSSLLSAASITLTDGDVVKIEIDTQLGRLVSSIIESNEPTGAFTAFQELSGQFYTTTSSTINLCNKVVAEFYRVKNVLTGVTAAGIHRGEAVLTYPTIVNNNILPALNITEFPHEYILWHRETSITTRISGIWALDNTPDPKVTVTDDYGLLGAVGATPSIAIPVPAITYANDSTYITYTVAGWPASLQKDGLTKFNNYKPSVKLKPVVVGSVGWNGNVYLTSNLYANALPADQLQFSGRSTVLGGGPGGSTSYIPYSLVLTPTTATTVSNVISNTAQFKMNIVNNNYTVGVPQINKNVWVAFEMPAGIDLADVKNTTTGITYSIANGNLEKYDPGNNKYWIKLGDMAYTSSTLPFQSLEINTTHTLCSAASFNAYAGSSPYGYPDNPKEGFSTVGVPVATFRASLKSQTFTIAPAFQALNIVVDNVVKLDNRFDNNAAGITPHAQITVTNNGSMTATGLYLTIDMPAGFTAINGTSKLSFKPGSGAVQNINISDPVLVSGKTWKWDISNDPLAITAGITSIGTNGTLSPYYTLSFDGKTVCEYTSGSVLVPKAYSSRLCGIDAVVQAISDNMFLFGVPPVIPTEQLSMSDLSTTIIKDDGSTAVFSGRITNPQGPIGPNQFINLVFPESLNVNSTISLNVNGSASMVSAGNITNSTSNGERTVGFPMPVVAQGSYVDFSVNMLTANSGALNCSDYAISARVIKEVVLTYDDLSTCNNKAINVEKTTVLTVKKASIAFSDIIGNSVYSSAVAEAATVKFKLMNNSGTGFTVPGNYSVDLFIDANGNHKYDSGETIISTKNITGLSLADGVASAEQTITGTVPVLDACNLYIALRLASNPNICDNVHEAVDLVYYGSALATSACSGTSITIGADNIPGVTYKWSAGMMGYLSRDDISNPVFTYNGPALLGPQDFQYTLTTTRPGGCSYSVNVIVTVQAISTPVVFPVSPVCGETTGSFSISNHVSGYTYSYDGGTNYFAATSFSNIAPGTYTVLAKNSTGCTMPSATFTIGPALITPVVILNYFSEYCVSGEATTTINVTAGGPVTGLFSAPSGIIFKDVNSNLNSVTGVIDLANSSPGTYTIRYTFSNTNGCSNTVDKVIKIIAGPVVTFNYGSAPFLCTTAAGLVSPAIAIVSGSITPVNFTYTGTGTLSLNATTGAINPVTSNPGTYEVSYNYTVGTGCNLSTKVTVVISSSPVIVLAAGSGSETQTVNINTAFAPIVFDITDANNSVNAVTVSGLPAGVSGSYDPATKKFTISGTPTVDGTFSYTITANGCVPVTRQRNIYVNQVVPGTISGDQVICYGAQPTQLTSAGSSARGTRSFTWQTSTDNIAFTDIVLPSGGTYTPPALIADTWYRLKVTSTWNTVVLSDFTTSIKITVQGEVDPGTITGPAAAICSGTSPGIISSVTPATTGVSFRWESSTTSAITGFSTVSDPTATSASFTPGILTQDTWFRRIAISTVTVGAITKDCEAATTAVKITVSAKLALSSTPGTDAQISCANTAISTITYLAPTTATNVIDNGTLAALGLSGTYNSGTRIYTITGTPTSSGNYILTVVGGTCVGSQVQGSVTINSVTPGALSADQALTSGATAGTLTTSVAATGSGTVTYKWQKSTVDGTTGFADAGVNTESYSPGAISVNTWFRRIAVSELNLKVCESVPSNVVSILVQGSVDGGTIAASQAFAGSGTATAFTSTQAGSGSGTPITYRWESSITDGTTGFSTIPSATSLTYSAGLINANTWFKRVTVATLSGVEFTAYSNVLSVLIQGNVDGGTIASSQAFAGSGTATAFTSTQAGSASGTPITYRWERSTTDGTTGFSTIPSANSLTYSPGLISASTWFRRVTVATLNGVEFTSPSNVLSILIQGVVDGGTIASNQAFIGSGTAAAFTSAQDGSGSGTPVTYLWEKSTVDGSSNFNIIPMETGATYSAGLISANTWFRRITVATLNGVEFTSPSNVLSVLMQGIVSPGSIANNQALNSGAIAASFTSVPGNGQGAISYRWQKSNTGETASDFTDIGVSTETYSPGVITTDTWFRRITVATLNNVPFESVPSNVVSILVQGTVTAGSIGADQTVCVNTIPATITSVDGTGRGAISYRWEKSTTDATTGFVTIPLETASTYSPSSISVKTWFRRVTIATLSGVVFQSVPTAAIAINITAPGTMALSSLSGTDAQTINLGIPLTSINYTIGGGATGALLTGDALPVGLISAYSNGVFSISGTPAVVGTYNYVLTTIGGCNPVVMKGTIRINNNLKIQLISAVSTSAQTICAGTPIVSIKYATTDVTSISISGLPVGVNGVFNNTTKEYDITGIPSVSGKYAYTISAVSAGGVITASGNIDVNSKTTIALTSGIVNQQTCFNSPVSITYTITGNASGVVLTGVLPAGVRGVFSNGKYVISGTPSSSGTFNYSVAATGECSSEIVSGSIIVNEVGATLASSETEISRGSQAVLTVSGGTSYKWSGEGILNGAGSNRVSVRPLVTTTYTVLVSNASGCEIILSVTIKVREDYNITPGNALSPNGDYKNDLWVIKNIDLYPNNTVTVFDRAGRKVYTARSYKNDWGGTANGEPLHEGTYFYVIDFGNGIIRRGAISIIYTLGGFVD